MDIPAEIQSVNAILELDKSEQGLYEDVQRSGPKITASVDAAKNFLSEHSDWSLDETHVSGVILFMTLNPDWEPYNVSNFVLAVEATSPSPINWSEVVSRFDRPYVYFSKPQFLTLYNALLPIAKAKAEFDIQVFWKGPYTSAYTHHSIISAFFSCSSSELDVTLIPNLRSAYNPVDSITGFESVAEIADNAKRDSTISLDAVNALMDMCIPMDEEANDQQLFEITHAVGEKIGLFVCSATRLERLSSARRQILSRLIQSSYLKRGVDDYLYVLHITWKHNGEVMAAALVDAHGADPLELTTMLDLALELGWMDDLLTLTNGFGFDLAALAHRKGLIDFTQWVRARLSASSSPEKKALFVNSISKFALLKAQEEIRISRDEQPEPRTVSLAVQTAYDMLAISEEYPSDTIDLKSLQRTFIQAYPRLILLCEGINENIDVDCKQSNAMPRSADAEMQELYKRMYGNDLDAAKVIKYLQECKESADHSKKDLFACMIHGLFDEYSCFSEYPLDPLSKTAVLFGGIIQCGLVSDLTLRVGREMVFDALSEYPPDAPMFKFGVQALMTFTPQLNEPEWVGYCKDLVQISALRTTPVYSAAIEALSKHGITLGSEETNGLDGVTNYPAPREDDVTEDIGASGLAPRFSSVSSGPGNPYEEPDESVKDKVVFFFNNVSQQNLGNKFEHLRQVLEEAHHGWFADFIVNARAKVEPNYQPLYLEILQLLDSKRLFNEVLRSTYLVIQNILDADATMQSASERKNLKSLATWLGSLTIAQDKPIRRRNISFLDLLAEGFQFEKLLLVIPFVCNVMAQGKHSNVFKPPNPWVMEIIAALVEFYYEGNITTNQKFDIEVLCDELSVKIETVEPSSILSERIHSIAEQQNVMISEGVHTFETISLGGINGAVQNPRFEVGALQLDLPDMENMLRFPPANGSVAAQNRLRELILDAVTHAIYEIIGSVVERSVTIASIAAGSLLHKDFACEEDQDRIRQAGERLVRELARNLALVTCKEPLRTSMGNFIRKAQADLPTEQVLPEGVILMCINDNVDTACDIVEKKAADQAIPEMEAQVEAEFTARARWRSEHPNEPYVGSVHSRWSTAIPEPFKQVPGGLRPEQLVIYTDFGRQSRGPSTHAQSSSADSGRQLPDILQDSYASASQGGGSAGNMGLAQQSVQTQQYQTQRERILPSHIQSSINQAQTNGYRDPAMVDAEVDDLLAEIFHLVLDSDSQASDECLDEYVKAIISDTQHYDSAAMVCAEKICQYLYGERPLTRRLAAIFVGILADLYQSNSSIAKEVAMWADMQSNEKMLNTDVTIELLKASILQPRKVDESLATLIADREEAAAEVLSIIVQDLWQAPNNPAFRTDFVRSLGALAEWRSDEKDDSIFTDEVWERVNQNEDRENVEDTPNELGMIRKHQVNYVFSEWIRLCEENDRNPNDKMFAAFAVQSHLRKLLQTPEDVTSFLRLCIDTAVMAFEYNQKEEFRSPHVGNEHAAYFNEIDWLAQLIILLVKSQGESNGSASRSKTRYMDSVLSIVTLIMNHHQVTRGEKFNQRIFFRLFSSILCGWYESARETPAQHEQMILVFAENFLSMQPRFFPGFVHSWLSLISHRLFLPNILKLPGNSAYDAFARIMEAALSFVSDLMKPNAYYPAAVTIYQALLRLLLLLHHDYPAFLADTHYRLCNAVPTQSTQLLNLLLSACPPKNQSLPNPFVIGLKIDRLAEMQDSPHLNEDYVKPLVLANVNSLLDDAMRNGHMSQEHVHRIVNAVNRVDATGVTTDRKLIHSIVLYIGDNAVSAAKQRNSSTFVSDSPHALLLQRLFHGMKHEARYHLICSMVNQLRWHNTHTHYFAYALLHLFGTEPAYSETLETKQYIVRVLLERIHTVLPHPWGLLVVLLELLKNPIYSFWQLPFVKNSPQVCVVCSDCLKLRAD